MDDRPFDKLRMQCIFPFPTPVGEGVTQLALLVQDGVAAQVDRVKGQQLEQGQQPARADLGDVHHGQALP